MLFHCRDSSRARFAHTGTPMEASHVAVRTADRDVSDGVLLQRHFRSPARLLARLPVPRRLAPVAQEPQMMYADDPVLLEVVEMN